MTVPPIKILKPWVFNAFRCLALALMLMQGHYSAIGQNYADSLETRFLMVENDEKIVILDKLIRYYFRNEPLLASERAEKMRSLSMQGGDKVGEIKVR